jgi:HD-like signal output (HDOD) protein
MVKSLNKLNDWVERINNADLPIFNRTVQEIVNIAEDSDSSLSELARVVLQDATLTARVIKLANTIFYNPSRYKINTVSRAIVLLGVENVRNLSLTIVLVDTFVQSKNRKFLMRELARSLHAASQASSFAASVDAESAEEIFVATLLYNIGTMTFWCFAEEEAFALNEIMKRGIPSEKAEETVLGFRLEELTQRLTKEWRLNDLLEKTLEKGASKSKKSMLVTMCHELAIVAEQGWASPAVDKTINDLQKLTNISASPLRKKIYENAVSAARISRNYGAEEARKLIPPPTVRVADPGQEESGDTHEYNPTLQLDILREITTLLFEKRDFNLLMGMILEGIYRGIGMDRTLFALLSPDRTLMKAKFVLGKEKNVIRDRFRFKLFTRSGKLFKHVIDTKEAVWIGAKDNPSNELVTDQLVKMIGGMDFYMMPVVVSDKVIGIVYADRIPSGRKLDQDSFENFKHFTQQASLGLEYISRLK